MKVRMVRAAGALLVTTALFSQVPAHAADASIVATGVSTMNVVGIGICTSPTFVTLKQANGNFVFEGLIVGGLGSDVTVGNAECVLVNEHFEYNNAIPEVVAPCVGLPVIGGFGGQLAGPASLSVSGSTYTVTRKVTNNCHGDTILLVNKLVVGASTVTYTFGEYINGATKPVVSSTGALTKISS